MAVKSSKATLAGATMVPYADMSLDGPEIGTLVAVIDRAKNLPNRRTMGKQDPYCAMRLGKEAKKTDTDRRGGQTPRWDQELRFTVHESPDYYKLKCSVFNDDKKTDLIGEAWIDLKEVIVSGGGQNDLWHQLNFKGKYAGDIRIELTYYDTRTDPELEAGKQRRKERAWGDDSSSNASSRHLGPREIKRRPLPPGPVHSAPAELPQPLRLQRQLPPQPSEPQHEERYQQLPHDANTFLPDQQPWTPPKQANDNAFNHNSSPYDEHNQQHYHYQHQQYDDHFEVDDRYLQQEPSPSHHLYAIDPRPNIPHSYSEPQPLRQGPSSPATSPYSSDSPTYTPQYSSPPAHQNLPALPDIPPRSNRVSASPTKYAAYRDSPLRQSISQHEDPYDNLDLEPPPPPPTHRSSLPRPPSSAQNTPPQPDQFRRLSQLPPSIGDRSPLQMIEHQYQQESQEEQRTPERRRPRNSYSSQATHDRQPTVVDSADEISVGDFPAPHQLAQNYGVDFTQPVEQDQRGRYIRRNSGLDDSPYNLPQRAHTFDTADVFDERNTFRSEPQVVRPRAVSPNANHSVPRKSVSPHPQARTGRSRLSGIPFGPDSYDIINPSSDAGPDPFTSPMTAHEFAMQQEVDKLSDQGPIIGNDGRVIDPSDHLPSDTWAPEPQRKQRQPEHVIRIRTREDARNSRAGSSPLPIKPVSASQSPFQPSPVTPPSQFKLSYENTPPQSSSQRRNRLQKQAPVRPLPTQPFPNPHAHSSPASIPQVHDFHPQPQKTPPRNSMPSSPMSGQLVTNPRHSMYQTPPSGPLSRPPLSDYQVPTANSYSPRGSYYPPSQPHIRTPTKIAPRPQSYANDGYEDPLAAEMRLIDIGPSRGGRTALRSNRGYGY